MEKFKNEDALKDLKKSYLRLLFLEFIAKEKYLQTQQENKKKKKENDTTITSVTRKTSEQDKVDSTNKSKCKKKNGHGDRDRDKEKEKEKERKKQKERRKENKKSRSRSKRNRHTSNEQANKKNADTGRWEDKFEKNFESNSNEDNALENIEGKDSRNLLRQVVENDKGNFVVCVPNQRWNKALTEELRIEFVFYFLFLSFLTLFYFVLKFGGKISDNPQFFTCTCFALE
ncbi:hypothetical protein RFI_28663 [Reticulomyxa filosa]|uniref:Uncharacterized protein n=1 Tax=Reticulomyxa filosa TaxID=46433 RepID=X6M6S3_RETFI|nr:hypothetical protein RFI_28663 [Reticulomyxa filosa]|eukprot:ETO08725.1 hypothetical protein RFI_28663 [Reticulomyxa filosa]